MIYVDYMKLIFDDAKKAKKEREASSEFMQRLRKYYDSHDTSAEMENGQWEYPCPEQLELDLGVIPIPFDENTVCTEATINIGIDYALSISDWNALMDSISDAVDQHFPSAFLSGSMRQGTDRELFPEGYNESKKTD